VIATLAEPGAGPDVARLRRAAGELWAAGAPVRLGALWQGERRRRVPLPTYPFERTRHWIDPDPEPADAVSTARSGDDALASAEWGVPARANGNGAGAEMPIGASAAVAGGRRIG
jgi:acyl transferase domain-containing protein